MKKLVNKIKNNKLYVISFITATFIISLLFKLNNTTPFGGKSLLCVDFYHQYGPMLGELYDRLRGGENLIYSFNMGLGLPFFRNFLNYLSSPFNIIMLLFPRKYLVTSYSFIIGGKAVASCLTMVYFLSKKFKTKELILIPLAILYAFQGYYAAYYWNIMWLDGMVFLPLIILGIENIVNKKKWKLYTLSLATMLFANYFIGYMICIFSVIYFIFYSVYKLRLKKENIKNEILNYLEKVAIFGLSSILAGTLVAFALLPMASSMTSISATGGSIPTTQYYLFNFKDFISGHFTGVNTTVFGSDEVTIPNISCGILTIGLLIVYLLNLEIPLKNKLAYLIILGFIIACFFIPQLDYIMHAFHVPNDLPYRYSFLYSFTLILIAAYSIMNIKKIKYPVVLASYIFLLLLLIIASQNNWKNIDENMIYINIILLTLYFIFYSGNYFIPNMKNIFYIALVIVAGIDVTVSINHNWNITQELKVFYEDYEVTEELLDYVEKQNKDKFYRIENIQMMTLNDGSWYDYYGMTTFSSMAYEKMAILQNNLGIPGNNINSYYYIQSTPIYDLMFNIKYFIGVSNDLNRYTEIKTIDETANEFKYNVGLAYGVNKNIKKWKYGNTNPFDYQNKYVEYSTGYQNIFETSNILKVEEVYNEGQTTILKYEIENKFDNLYLYSKDYTVDFMLIGDALYYSNDNYSDIASKSDEITYSYAEDYNENKVININSTEDSITLYVAYTGYFTKGFEISTINHNKFTDVVKKLTNNKLDITNFKEYKIEGNIYLDDNMDIYTSIPYDEGWHAYIDGLEAKTYSLEDALLMIEGKKGKHKITLEYKTPYFKSGLILTIISIIILIGTTILEKKYKKAEEN